MTDFGLPQRTIADLVNYFKTQSYIEKVCIYGSRAKGTYRNGSDIDIAIWTDEHDTIVKIASDLDNLPTPYKFDVTDYKTLKHQGMIDSINKDGIILYQRD